MCRSISTRRGCHSRKDSTLRGRCWPRAPSKPTLSRSRRIQLRLSCSSSTSRSARQARRARHAEDAPPRGGGRRAEDGARAISTGDLEAEHAPPAGRLVTVMSPPISRANSRLMARPSPAPPPPGCRCASARRAGRARRSLRRRCPPPCPPSATIKPRRGPRWAGAHLVRTVDAAALGELDRVAQQVDEDLPQLAPVGDDVGRHVGRPRVMTKASCLASARARNGARSRRAAPRGRRWRGRAWRGRPRCLRHLQHVVEGLEQLLAAPADHLERAAARGPSGVALEELGVAEHGVHRRADLVRHVGEERALGVVRRVGGVAWRRAAPRPARRAR